MSEEITHAAILTAIEEIKLSISRSFTSFENRFDKKLDTFRFETNIRFDNLETDLRSFKKDTQQNFDRIFEIAADHQETLMNHDKRIEVLEEKVLA
ncbi:MAG TPA: hypothetical protein VFE57_07160 [Cyclobacteriaceae bacterium]|jgi:hypothetical protein|nr:hypothetical protein [Cyclobacteriaceae bacterium]